eukprot:3050188-Rhodomonas_salina.1
MAGAVATSILAGYPGYRAPPRVPAVSAPAPNQRDARSIRHTDREGGREGERERREGLRCAGRGD